MNPAHIKGWREVLKIAWPLVVANSFWNLQLTIDRIFLGNFSTDALAAVVAVMGIYWVPMALLQQTAGYLTTFVAQYVGAKRPHMIGPAVWQSIYISIIGGLLFLLLIPLAPTFYELMGHSLKIQKLEIEYFQALCYSAMPVALVAAASAFFTGQGKSKVIMGINCVGLIANVFFDYLFIFGKHGVPALGVAGAGYATTLANWSAAIFGFYLVFSKSNETQFSIRSQWKYQADLMRRFLRYGVPSGLQWALEGLAFTVFLVFIGRLPNGDAALAGSGIAVTIMLLALLPSIGVGQAVSVLVGQHLGEDQPQKAEKSTWYGLHIAALYIFLTAVTFVAFPQFYLSWFHNPADPVMWNQVSEMVPYLLMFVSFFTCFDSMNIVFSFALKGAGDTRFVTFVALTLPWPFMVFPSWLVRNHIDGVYWAWAAASFFIVLQALVFLYRFKMGLWKNMRVID